jgi:Nif-specific regulatory protein
MHAWLTIEDGQGTPSRLELTPSCPATLGRHRKNHIVLHDEHASRQHAEVYYEDGRWFIRNINALNGTRVNGTPVNGVTPLADGQVVCIGNTTLCFHLEAESDSHRTLVQQGASCQGEPSRDTIPASFRTDELTALCQFMHSAVDETDPHLLIRRGLEAIHERTRASVTGFLSFDEEEPLPKVILPEIAHVDIHLSRRLTRAVRRQNKAVTLRQEHEESSETDSLMAFQDALCVPLRVGCVPLGAIHIYKAGPGFLEQEVRFCEIVAGYLASTLRALRWRRTLEAENVRLRVHSTVADDLIGVSPAIQRLRATIDKAASSDSLVLITGETGSGKELVANALHLHSRRSKEPFVVMNCAAISPNLVESELFGHCRGAFTGADAARPGYFQQADDGTLFLDEVGELSLECQAKLLRIIEGKGFRPVGGQEEVRVNVRVIAATHRNLAREVAEKRFREDLYFRLEVIHIEVPPLREHAEDIPALVKYYLDRWADEDGRRFKVSKEALERLQSYSWPGNVRQLRSVLESAVAMGNGGVLQAADLLLPSRDLFRRARSLKLEDIEKSAIRRALRRANWNVSKAALMLGIARDTLTNKIKKYAIQREGGGRSEGE